jgi:hypothetical protein
MMKGGAYVSRERVEIDVMLSNGSNLRIYQINIVITSLIIASFNLK